MYVGSSGSSADVPKVSKKSRTSSVGMEPGNNSTLQQDGCDRGRTVANALPSSEHTTGSRQDRGPSEAMANGVCGAGNGPEGGGGDDDDPGSGDDENGRSDRRNPGWSGAHRRSQPAKLYGVPSGKIPSGGNGGGNGGGGHDGGDGPHNEVWKTIPCGPGVSKFLVLLEARLRRHNWSNERIWRALGHVRDNWLIPVNVDSGVWNSEHSNQTSQLVNRLQHTNTAFKVQASVDSVHKIPDVKEAFAVLADTLAKGKRRALSKKVIMRFFSLIDDLNGNVMVGNFRLTIRGLTALLQWRSMYVL